MHPPAVYPGSLARRVIQWECVMTNSIGLCLARGYELTSYQLLVD